VERVGEWRVIDADETDEASAPKVEAVGAAKSRAGLYALIATVALVVLGVAGVAIWATLPQGGVALDLAKGPNAAAFNAFAEPSLAAVSGTAGPALIVDVEGAVVEPGVHSVPAGSRVADAIAAAGGYSTEVDIAAAALALNLAEHLVDGQKIHVPARGELVVIPGATSAPGGGLVDINHASQEQLESLPGIGPVTAAKIIAARPFGAIDELDSRDVVGPSVMEQIRDLITVTP
jgi:competence protein ComEA